MTSAYPLFIGLRYSFSRKRNRFTAVIATVSLLGMVVGVASLISVLSVMNGFAGELRSRILSLIPHGYVQSQQGPVQDWTALAQTLTARDDILGAAPYIETKAILGARGVIRGVKLIAVDPALESEVSQVASSMTAGTLDALTDERWGIVVGSVLARWMGVDIGDQVEITVPYLTLTPLGTFPRSKQLTVVGVFEVGATIDAQQAYIHLRSGQKLLGLGEGVDGLQLRSPDLFMAPEVFAGLGKSLPAGFEVIDWSQTQGSLFRAVKMEKVMVSLLLLSVVAVAAFNIISTLAMSVAEKRGDIAVLRTMGASAAGVMAIFMVHGLGLALAGVGIGVVLGVTLALNIADLTAFIENLLGVKLFDPSVYFISELPAQLQANDVVWVAVAAIVLSLVATLYPAWRAAQVDPAEVLRYE